MMNKDQVKKLEELALTFLKLAFHAKNYAAQEECINQALEYIKKANDAGSTRRPSMTPIDTA